MESAVNKRVMTYLKSKSITIKNLASIIGVNEKTLGNKLTGRIRLDLETILAILSSFDALSAEWLLRGQGSIERSALSSDTELQNICLEQAREIYRLKNKIALLEGEKEGI